jgi:Ca-activated chloride channel family protein
MKPAKVALLSFAGMLLSSVSVYSFTPPGGFPSGPSKEAIVEPESTVNELPTAPSELGSFTADGTLRLEARVGHAKTVRTGPGEELVMVEVSGAENTKAKAASPANLSIVIDRSGSMRGTRIRNAIAAAETAVQHLNDGDVVSVVTFDTQVQTVVSPTVIGAGQRERVQSDIRRIQLGGDTCISCGIELGMTLLEQTPGRVNRMIVLSDGDANNGVRDVPGFRAMAQRALGRSISITTIGVDVDFNEKILSAIAEESNGRHYFVENDAALARVFEQETESLTQTIASNAEVAIDLAPGVELDRVFDRAFRRAGNRIFVPLGSFSQKDTKTVLLKVRVAPKSDEKLAVASVELAYRDLVRDADQKQSGKLEVGVTKDAEPIDPVVNARLQRSETAAALKDANRLFEQGKGEEARRRLATQQTALASAASAATRAAPSKKKADVSRDFEGQLAAVNDANNGFQSPFASPPSPNGAPQPASPPPPSDRQGKAQVRSNQQKASEFGF